jgi:hypothetical protein
MITMRFKCSNAATSFGLVEQRPSANDEASKLAATENTK